eukprot:2499658-Rhodomonas_salina.2
MEADQRALLPRRDPGPHIAIEAWYEQERTVSTRHFVPGSVPDTDRGVRGASTRDGVGSA